MFWALLTSGGTFCGLFSASGLLGWGARCGRALCSCWSWRVTLVALIKPSLWRVSSSIPSCSIVKSRLTSITILLTPIRVVTGILVIGACPLSFRIVVGLWSGSISSDCYFGSPVLFELEGGPGGTRLVHSVLPRARRFFAIQWVPKITTTIPTKRSENGNKGSHLKKVVASALIVINPRAMRGIALNTFFLRKPSWAINTRASQNS